jgi:hypothetical protein
MTMEWARQESDFLPENGEEFDDAELASAIESERIREYAALFETAPRWLEDVA